jgi:hypothetical protein
MWPTIASGGQFFFVSVADRHESSEVYVYTQFMRPKVTIKLEVETSHRVFHYRYY